jgi:outer membrane protein
MRTIIREAPLASPPGPAAARRASVPRILRGALAAVLLWTAAPLSAQSLADALAAGYEASGLVEQNRALLRAADEDVAQAVAALRPIVSWTATATGSLRYGPQQTLFGPSPGNELSSDLTGALALAASLTLYDAGARALAVEAQKELVLATRQSLLSVEGQVLGRVVAAYTEVLRQGSFVQLRENNVRLITQELSAARERFDVGEITRTDVALAEARLASAQSQLAAEQGGLARAQAEFRAGVGSAPRGLSTVPRAVIPATAAEARAIALRSSPALLQAQHEVAASEINIRRAEAALRPTVDLQGRLQIDDEFTESANVTLRAQGPIYQGGALASQVRQFQARRDATRAGLLETARQIEQDVANAYAGLEVARASRQAFEQQVRAAQVAFEGVREEAQLGARTTLDVLDAEQELLDARASLVSAEIDETVSTYQVLSSMGLLTVQNLGLAVQVYDPTAYYDLVDDAPAAVSQQGRALDRVLEAIGAGQ